MATIDTSTVGHQLKRRYGEEKPQSLTRKKAKMWMKALDTKIKRARNKMGL